MSAAISILLVDDDCHLVESMADSDTPLSSGFNSIQFDGRQGTARRIRFDLVITDLRLGNEDGFDQISTSDKGTNIPLCWS